MARKSDYKTDLLADLRSDLGYASEYLSAAYADSQEAFLVALRDVAEAKKGLAKVAEQTKLNRENLYRTLSKRGNPTLSTLSGVLDAMDLKIAVIEKGAELPPPFKTSPPLAQTQKASAVRTSVAFVSNLLKESGSAANEGVQKFQLNTPPAKRLGKLIPFPSPSTSDIGEPLKAFGNKMQNAPADDAKFAVAGA